MAADKLLADAERHLGEALDSLEAARSEVPAYVVDSMCFLRAEVKLVIRRIQNCQKVIRGSGKGSA